jgi:4a-hydroxytetrahydrobiopterin dehydratase
MALHKLNVQDAEQQLKPMPLWQFDSIQGAITREFVWPDFVQAFAFMSQIAVLAESHQHHPEWHNVYNKVRITWTTHDVQGLSSQDIEMARLCDELFIAGTTLNTTK